MSNIVHIEEMIDANGNVLFDKVGSSPAVYTLKRDFDWFTSFQDSVTTLPLGEGDSLPLESGDILDGNNYTITFDSSGSDKFCNGVVFLYGTTINNIITIRNLNVAYLNQAFIGYGGIVGDCGNVAIYNCHVTGTLITYGSGGIYKNLTQDNNTTALIYNCSFNGNIVADGGGGICGPETGMSTGGIAIIYNCYSTGEISGTGSGGIVGSSCSSVDGTATIIYNCYSIGDITGSSAGGITGSTTGIGYGTVLLYNCCTIGNPSGADAGALVGASSGNNLGSGGCIVYNCTSNATQQYGSNSPDIIETITGPINILNTLYSINTFTSGSASNAKGLMQTNTDFVSKLNTLSGIAPAGTQIMSITNDGTEMFKVSLGTSGAWPNHLVATIDMANTSDTSKWGVLQDFGSAPTVEIHPELNVDASCFNAGTKILIYKNGIDQYEIIENLRKGDLVKTYKHGYRRIILLGKGFMRNDPTSWSKSMYIVSKDVCPEVTEDLYLTGGHCLLVDDLGDEYNVHKSITRDTVDSKHLLIVGKSTKFQQILTNKKFTYYHFAVENDGNIKRRYGVYANGVLTETPPEEHFYKFPYAFIE